MASVVWYTGDIVTGRAAGVLRAICRRNLLPAVP